MRTTRARSSRWRSAPCSRRSCVCGSAERSGARAPRPEERLDLRDLVEGELDRCFAVEDVDEDLELRLTGVDLADRAVEIGEWARGDPDDVALFEPEAHRRLGLFLL